MLAGPSVPGAASATCRALATCCVTAARASAPAHPWPWPLACLQGEIPLPLSAMAYCPPSALGWRTQLQGVLAGGAAAAAAQRPGSPALHRQAQSLS